MVPAARGFACAPPEPRSGLDVPGSPPAASSGDGAEGAAHRRARRRWRTAILSAATFDPYLRARQHRTDHWRPLALRFDAPRYHPIAAEPGGEGRAKAPAGPPPSAFGKARGPSAGGGGLRRGSMPHLHAGSNLGGLDRSEVRLLRAADAHVRIPPNLNAWLTDRANCAPDALHEGGRQRVLYTAKISLRFKDHILSQSPCAYPISCPFPVSVGQYAYDLWRVYTCQGCPAGFKAWDQPMLWHAKAYDQRAYLHVYSNRIEVNQPSVRCPWGVLGCGSWNEDHVAVHYFDRGAFGFRRVPCASRFHCCCAWEPFGEVLGRQRCPCNGPLVDGKGTVRCGQWCCDHWLCATCCCHYHYPGLADAEEAATAAEVALQAFFDKESLSQQEFDKRLDAELAARHQRKRRARPKGFGDGSDRRRAYDHDSHAYSRSMTLVAIAIGALTLAIQIFVVIALALYVQYRSHRQWYIDYAHTLSQPEHYSQIFENATRTADTLLG